MSIIAQLTVRAKPETYKELAQLLAGELRTTAKAKGIERLSCATDPTTFEFRIWEIWQDTETFRNYLSWRTDRADFRKVDALSAEPYEIREFDCLEY